MNLLNIEKREYKEPIQVRMTPRSNINKYLRAQYGVGVLWDKVGKAWMIEKGEYRGNLPKRVASYFRKHFDVKLTKSDLAHIGNLSDIPRKVTDKIEFEINSNLRWMRGDFGDPNSCFWTCHTAARLLLEDEGASAVKWYKNGKGFARAFILKYGTDKYILFNAYGLVLDCQADYLCDALSLHKGRIELNNYGSSEGDLYINNGQGFLLSKDEEKAKKAHNTTIVLEMNFEDDWFNYVTCLECGDITAKKTYIVQDIRVCRDCYDNKRICKTCDEIVFYSSNDLSKIPTDLEIPKDECFRCFKKRMTYCIACDLINPTDANRVFYLNNYFNNLEERKVCKSCCANKKFCSVTAGLYPKRDCLEVIFKETRLWVHFLYLYRLFSAIREESVKGLTYDKSYDKLTFDPNYYNIVGDKPAIIEKITEFHKVPSLPDLKPSNEIVDKTGEEIEAYKKAICE